MSKYSEYIKNPNKCEYCNNDILAKDGENVYEVMKKKYCNYQCFKKKNAIKINSRLCKECGEQIPNYAIIDGKRKNLSSRVYCLNCVPFGDKRHKQYANEELNKKDEEIRQRRVKSVTDRRKRVKEKAVEYKGNKCLICGYKRYIGALEFHHLNPEEKDFNISSVGASKSWDKIQEELDKCICVCSNCHKEIHAELIDVKEYLH